jgi:hypothetical protein
MLAHNPESLPLDYPNYLAQRSYLEREAKTFKNFSVATLGEIVGLAWHYGPLRFERYVGDVEPNDNQHGPLRLVTWQRLTRLDEPKNWKKSRLVMPSSRTGFATVEPAGDYTTNWTSHAKRHRKNWLKQSDWQIMPITAEEYINAYQRSKMRRSLKNLFTDLVRKKITGHGEHIKIIGAKTARPDAAIEAGFAFVDVPETGQSIHLTSFFNSAARPVSAGTGLIDAWFNHARDNNIKYLEFGLFWTPGEPDSWQGFSQFKSQFGVQFVDYPKPLVRWMGSWKEIF